VRDPLVIRDTLAGAVFRVTAAGWAVAEAFIQLRSRVSGGRARDWTFAVVGGSTAAGILLGFAAARVDGLSLPGDERWWAIAGIALMWAGIALRLWAVLELGALFRVRIEIQAGHRIVDSGPYAVLRHPSYTGLLVTLLGLGLALGSALSVIALVVIPGAGLLVRIEVEERQLRDALGEQYERYARRRRRLIPGVW
jgi:protein-S-isoprenylcysteine O-methyltransferase